MIGLFVLLINCWVMALGYESFISNMVAMGGAVLGEFLIEIICIPALDENPWEKLGRILNDKNR